MTQREIKFRAYNTALKTMGEPFTLQDAIGSRLRDGVDTEGVIYMQFTGLHDKNGKEIYEGDVVLQKYVGSDTEDTYAIPELQRFFHLHGEHMMTPEEAEIIGNIYENPDLLK